MNLYSIVRVDTPRLQQDLDQILWEVLWKPLDLPRNIRDSFPRMKNSLELAVLHGSRVVGGLVLTWQTEDEVELRHLAVLPEFQKQRLGKELVLQAIEHVARLEDCALLTTHSRKNCIAFFDKIGFFEAEGELQIQPAFSKHGIQFQKMQFDVRGLPYILPIPPQSLH